jgi:signal transduction histidine kinase
LLPHDDRDRQQARRTSPELFAKIEQAKQEWETTADALPELICLIDHRGRIIRANRTIETWRLGRVDRITGADFHTFIHPACDARTCCWGEFLKQAWERARLGQSAELEVYDIVLRRYLLIAARPVPAQRRVPNSLVIVIQDVSDRKQAENVRRRYMARLEVMNQIQEAILASRSTEEIAQAALRRIRQLVPVQHARVTLFERERSEFLVLAADANGDTHLRPGATVGKEAFEGAATRQPDRFYMVEDLLDVPDPSPVERELRAAAIRAYASIPLRAEGEFIGSFSLGAYQPAAFNQEHLDIADEVADLLAIAIRQAQVDRQLQKANAELAEARQVKDTMIQNVSHELRTPLFLIKGYAEMVREGLAGPVTTEQEDALNTVEAQSNRLAYMVSQLLALKALNSAQLVKVAVSPAELLQDAADCWKLLGAKAGIQLRVELEPDLPSCLADPNLMHHVIGNLLDNAIKFSPRGGLVYVRASRVAGNLLIAIADQGIGIPADKVEKIFERFYQIENGLNRRFGGMGIGLALCQEIVQAHAGRIWAESAGEGRGSTFLVSLPLAAV